MLFRLKNGKLKEMNRLDYLNDELYIDELLKIFNINFLDNKEISKETSKETSKEINDLNIFLKKYSIPNINYEKD